MYSYFLPGGAFVEVTCLSAPQFPHLENGAHHGCSFVTWGLYLNGSRTCILKGGNIEWAKNWFLEGGGDKNLTLLLYKAQYMCSA